MRKNWSSSFNAIAEVTERRVCRPSSGSCTRPTSHRLPPTPPIRPSHSLAGITRASRSFTYACRSSWPVPALPAPADRVGKAEKQRAREQATACLRARAVAGVGVDVDVEAGDPRARDSRFGRSPARRPDRDGDARRQRVRAPDAGIGHWKGSSKAVCPVLTVPPRAHATSTLPLSRIVCAVDFSEWSLAAVDLVASIAREPGASLILAHVIEWRRHEPPAPVFEDLPAEQSAALQEYRRYVGSRATKRLRRRTTWCERPRVRC